MRDLLAFLTALVVIVALFLLACYPPSIDASQGFMWAGYTCEGAGLVITAAGIFKTWKHYRSERSLDALFKPFEAAYRWVRVHVFSRPVDARVGVSSADALAVALSAEGRVTHGGPLDVTDLSAALLELHARLSALREDFDSFTATQRDQQEETERQIREIEQELSKQQRAVREMEQRVSTDGLRREAFGLTLVGLGLILQAFGTVLS